MKKIIFSFVLVFLCLSTSSAQLLWQITGKDLPKPSYLFGTHHLIPIQFLDSIPGLYKAFNRCDVVVGEIQMNVIDEMDKLQRATIMPDNTTMKDLLSKEDYALVDAELKSVLKLGLKELAILNPEIINTMYVTELYKKTTGITDDTQADSYFQLVAIQQDKEVVGLESVDRQIEILLGNKTLQQQAQDLVETIKTKDELLVQSHQLDSLYRRGDLAKLVKLSKDEMSDDEYYTLVDRRNYEWSQVLPQHLKKSSCFIAVGALHLDGENGLINLLKKEGYKVKAIENDKFK